MPTTAMGGEVSTAQARNMPTTAMGEEVSTAQARTSYKKYLFSLAILCTMHAYDNVYRTYVGTMDE